jgi:hypothetical protein
MGLQRGPIQKFQKRIFQKLYKNLVFDFFTKNQPICVKSAEEYSLTYFDIIFAKKTINK